MREAKGAPLDQPELAFGVETNKSSAGEPAPIGRRRPHRRSTTGAPGSKSSAEPASISGLVLKRVLGDYLAARACDWRTLVGSGELAACDFTDVDARISWDDERKLWRKAERLTGDSEVGLHSGAGATHATLDALGYVMRTSSTLRDALAAAARYHRFVVAGTAVSFDFDQSEVTNSTTCSLSSATTSRSCWLACRVSRTPI